MKKVLFSVISVLVVGGILFAFFSIQPTGSKIKAYFSGDAISFNNQIVVATTNTGKLELFTVNSQTNFKRFSAFKSFDSRYGTETDFKDVLLNIENGTLFAYAVDGRALIKYDITNLQTARAVARAEDNSWDWFGGLEKIDGYIATVGTNGVKLWTGNLLVKDQYKITTPGTYTFNSTPAFSKKYLFTVADEVISVFDKEIRQTITRIPVQFSWVGEFYKRTLYNDHDNSFVYVVDDEAVRKLDFNGRVEKSFDHTGPSGYDVVPSLNEEHLYFSDGIGVVKLRKSDLKVINYVYTESIGGNGGWATGLKVVRDHQGLERIVLFNSANILIFDSNLKALKDNKNNIMSFKATEFDPSPTIKEAVYLNIDRNRAAPGSIILLSGGGFGQDEALTIKFVDTELIIKADENGTFSTLLTVPVVSKRGADIKVTGQITDINYSLGFNIE